MKQRAQQHTHDRVEGELLSPSKFVVPAQDASYDNPYGFPDLSMCFWPVAFKKGG
uniref:phage portal protein family protein n=1 Tax=Escherichia coli TaxID=562 RepID=UPI00356B69DC